LKPNKSRIEFDCEIKGKPFKIWVDTGSPNTLVHGDIARILGLVPIKGLTYSGAIAGIKFEKKPAIVIPEITISDFYPLKNVRAIAGFNEAKWKNIILIGLNVLNHISYKITRNQMPGTFEWIETLTPNIPTSSKSKFNYLIINGEYMMTD
jgi:predicted aspartyl protease